MRRAALALFILMTSATVAFGSLWESQDWALLGTMAGSTGYDSDLTLLHDGRGGYFVSANPSMIYEKKNTETDTEFSGSLTETDFITGGQPTETDFSLGALFQYPNDKNVIPVYLINATLTRSSQPNQFLGHRVEFYQGNLSGETNFRLTGKLGFSGSGQVGDTRYEASTLNDEVNGGATVGLTYTQDSNTVYSLNVGGSLGHSTPNDGDREFANVHSDQYDVTARIRGQITEKITGNVYGGFGVVNYSGGYSNRDTIPVAGADLTWGISTTRTLVLAAYSGSADSPDGTAIQTSHAFLSFTDVIVGGWQFTARTGPTHSVFSQEVVNRRDSAWDYGMELAYNPSKQFRVAIDVNYSRRNSDVEAFQFDHDVISLNASYSF